MALKKLISEKCFCNGCDDIDNKGIIIITRSRKTGQIHTIERHLTILQVTQGNFYLYCSSSRRVSVPHVIVMRIPRVSCCKVTGGWPAACVAAYPCPPRRVCMAVQRAGWTPFFSPSFLLTPLGNTCRSIMNH